jgi:hypothetical protein
VWLPVGAEREALTVSVELNVGKPELELKLQINQAGGLSKERLIEDDPLCNVAVTV